MEMRYDSKFKSVFAEIRKLASFQNEQQPAQTPGNRPIGFTTKLEKPPIGETGKS
jgi:hypothetical protein